MRPILVASLSLVLGAACAVLVACGSSSNPALLSASRGDQLSSGVDAVTGAVDNQDCAAARRAVSRLRKQVDHLPGRTDPRLRQRLQEGVANLAQLAAADCHPQTTTTQTTPTQTVTTDTTPTQTVTTQTTTTTTSTPTPTTPRTVPTTPRTTSTPTTTSSTGGTGGTTVPRSGSSGGG